MNDYISRTQTSCSPIVLQFSLYVIKTKHSCSPIYSSRVDELQLWRNLRSFKIFPLVAWIPSLKKSNSCFISSLNISTTFFNFDNLNSTSSFSFGVKKLSEGLGVEFFPYSFSFGVKKISEGLEGNNIYFTFWITPSGS